MEKKRSKETKKPKTLKTTSIKALNEIAEQSIPKISPNVNIDAYYNNLRELYGKFKGAQKRDDMEMQYVYLYIYTVMLMERIPTHPQFKKKGVKRYGVFRRTIKDVIVELEMLKHALKTKYNPPKVVLIEDANTVVPEQLKSVHPTAPSFVGNPTGTTNAKTGTVNHASAPTFVNDDSNNDIYNYDWDSVQEKKKTKDLALPPPPKGIQKRSSKKITSEEKKEEKEEEEEGENDVSKKLAKGTAKVIVGGWKGAKKVLRNIRDGIKNVVHEVKKINEEDKKKKKEKKMEEETS